MTSATDVVVAAGENEDGVDEALAQDMEISEHCGVFQHLDGSTVKHLDHMIFCTSMSDTLIPKSSSEVVELQELAEQEKLFLKCLRKRAEREAKKKLEKEQKKAAAKKLKEDARLWISGSQGAQEPSYSVDLSGFVMEKPQGFSHLVSWNSVSKTWVGSSLVIQKRSGAASQSLVYEGSYGSCVRQRVGRPSQAV